MTITIMIIMMLVTANVGDKRKLRFGEELRVLQTIMIITIIMATTTTIIIIIRL